MTLMASLSLLFLSLLLMLSATSPLSLGSAVLLLALAFCCLLALFMPSWFSLLLFLIYVGALLILFAYFITLSPNQFHLFSVTPLTLFAILVFVFFFFMVNPPLLALVPTTSFYAHALGALFSLQNLLALNFAALTLFFTLLAVVKAVALPVGPLRPFLSRGP